MPGRQVPSGPDRGIDKALTSDAIRAARVLCIFFVMYVHVYSGFADFPVLRSFGPEDVLYHLLFDMLGRSSVPLLTIISGWLLAESGKRFAALVTDKFWSLLVPLALWNLAMLILVAAYALATRAPEALPLGLLPLLDALLAISDKPINAPLGFLRDLFVIMAVSPVLVGLSRKLGLALPMAAFALAVLVPHTPIILRTQIVFFFCLGVWAHQTSFTNFGSRTLALALAYATAYFLLDLRHLQSGETGDTHEIFEVLNRLSVAALFWTAARSIARSHWNATFHALEPYAFLAFCSHYITFRVLSIPGEALFGTLRSGAYPLYFLIQPAIGYGVAIVIAVALQPVPRLLRLANAGRLPPGLPGLPARSAPLRR